MTQITATLKNAAVVAKSDESEVFEVADLDVEYQVGFPKAWVFRSDDEYAQDLHFDTENEACAAQQAWRMARGCDPTTGKAQDNNERRINPEGPRL